MRRASAAANGSFTLGLQGLGAFPGARKPRVLWLGAAQGAAEGVALALFRSHSGAGGARHELLGEDPLLDPAARER